MSESMFFATDAEKISMNFVLIVSDTILMVQIVSEFVSA